MDLIIAHPVSLVSGRKVTASAGISDLCASTHVTTLSASQNFIISQASAVPYVFTYFVNTDLSSIQAYLSLPK